MAWFLPTPLARGPLCAIPSPTPPTPPRPPGPAPAPSPHPPGQVGPWWSSRNRLAPPSSTTPACSGATSVGSFAGRGRHWRGWKGVARDVARPRRAQDVASERMCVVSLAPNARALKEMACGTMGLGRMFDSRGRALVGKALGQAPGRGTAVPIPGSACVRSAAPRREPPPANFPSQGVENADVSLTSQCCMLFDNRFCAHTSRSCMPRHTAACAGHTDGREFDVNAWSPAGGHRQCRISSKDPSA